jgi:hypothetical protein
MKKFLFVLFVMGFLPAIYLFRDEVVTVSQEVNPETGSSETSREDAHKTPLSSGTPEKEMSNIELSENVERNDEIEALTEAALESGQISTEEIEEFQKQHRSYALSKAQYEQDAMTESYDGDQF